MAFNEILAHRVREVMVELPGFNEKRMFGGVGFMLHGHMACGVNKDDLIIRVGAETYEDALTEAHTRPFDLTGRPMTGWVVVEADGYQTDEALRAWVERGIAYALSLPPK